MKKLLVLLCLMGCGPSGEQVKTIKGQDHYYQIWYTYPDGHRWGPTNEYATQAGAERAARYNRPSPTVDIEIVRIGVPK